MTGLEVLVPVKATEAAKTRLAGAFAPEQRRALVRAMLADVLAAVAATPGPARVAVVTSDPAAAAAARALGVAVVDDGGLAWNEGLAHAVALAAADAEAVLIVSADLPLVTPSELADLVAALPARGIAVGRAHDGGTNALALRPPAALVPNFGAAASAALHVARARAAGLEAVVVDRPGLAHDLDTPADAAHVLAAAHGGRTRELLAAYYRNRSDSGLRTSSDAEPSPAAS